MRRTRTSQLPELTHTRQDCGVSLLFRLLKMISFALTLFAAMSIAGWAETFATLLAFDRTDGATPYASLTQGVDGSFYGTTYAGGAQFFGTFFKINAAGKLTTLYSFCKKTGCRDGFSPVSGVVLGTDGSFYGTTLEGGSRHNSHCVNSSCGTVFKITAAGRLTTLHSFCAVTKKCKDGFNPHGRLVQGSDGNLYGTTVGDACVSNCGTVFSVTPTGQLTTLFTFSGGDGEFPNAGLVQGTDGNFYGTTSSGGAHFFGTVFKITPAGTHTTLYSFTGGANGAAPDAGLVQGADGNFYGTTNLGGTSGICSSCCGTVFKITPAGQQTTLYSFCTQSGCPDGSMPVGGLMQGTDGNFYGTTAGDGCATSCGTVFSVTPAGNLTNLHSFSGSDGDDPTADLLQSTVGPFYGTAAAGDMNNCSSGCGTVFSLSLGLGPFVAFVNGAGKVGTEVGILGQGLTGTSAVSFNGTAAQFAVHSSTYVTATVPSGATTGLVTVTTPRKKLKSNQRFQVIP